MSKPTIKPTINEMLKVTLARYGAACREWGHAIASKDHARRRVRSEIAARHQTMMHHLISMIETAPNLGEDTTALLPPVGVEARSAMGDLQQEDITKDTPGCPHCGLITCNGLCPTALKEKPDAEETEEVESD